MLFDYGVALPMFFVLKDVVSEKHLISKNNCNNKTQIFIIFFTDFTIYKLIRIYSWHYWPTKCVFKPYAIFDFTIIFTQININLQQFSTTRLPHPTPLKPLSHTLSAASTRLPRPNPAYPQQPQNYPARTCAYIKMQASPARRTGPYRLPIYNDNGRTYRDARRNSLAGLSLSFNWNSFDVRVHAHRLTTTIRFIGDYAKAGLIDFCEVGEGEGRV